MWLDPTTEPASRWSVLSRVTSNGQVSVSRQEAEIPFEGDFLVLKLRTGRPGRFELRARPMTRPRGSRDASVIHPLADNSLGVTVSTGANMTVPLTGDPITLVVHSPADGTATTMTLRPTRRVHREAYLQDLTWTWTPDPVK